MIGKVDYIDTAFLTPGYIEDFRLHKEFGGGAFYDLGCYCTTMILSLIDSDIEYAKAMAEFTDEDVDYFDKEFPPKEKQKLPGQIFG